MMLFFWPSLGVIRATGPGSINVKALLIGIVFIKYTSCGLPKSLSGLIIFEIPFMNSEDLQKLVTFAMPYGKYKGRVIAELPGHYLNWFAREGFPNGELGRLLALMHEIDHNGLKQLLDPLKK